MIRFIEVNLLIVLTLIVCMTSCKQSFHKIINDDYRKQDTLIVCDYLILNNVQEGLFRYTYTATDLFSDSIFKIVKTSFQKLNIKLQTNNSKNAVDSIFLAHKYNSIRKPPNELILNITKRCNNKLVLVPFIELYHGSLSAEGGPTYFSKAYFTVFIVKNNEIIYAYDYLVTSKWYNTAEDENDFSERPFNLHTENDWDELIKGAMQPYLDRLK